MERRWSLLVWLLTSVVLVAFFQWRVAGRFQWSYTPLNELSITEHYSEDLGALFLGSHRLAADIAYIQFLQYYGVHEEELEAHEHHEDEHISFPRLKELATR